MWKRLLPVPFVILAVVVAFVAFRSSSPQPQGDSPAASSSSSVPPVPSGSAVDAPLTKKEQQDMAIRLNPSQCEEVQKRVEAMPDPPPGDPRSIRLMAACMRHGNVAWDKCTAGATTRTEIQLCSRRYMFNVMSP